MTHKSIQAPAMPGRSKGSDLHVSGMDSPIMVGLTCLVGCSTRTGQRVLSTTRGSLRQLATTWG
ncbi:unnamed protein product [Staurois parvus]|uniref:Uncharacterized protein n=1 Tax=Staurois parvus TaxID=386267 RepID=A0ABN9B059_9NEOB|nr:unnamed protein product [Staurois parvus]